MKLLLLYVNFLLLIFFNVSNSCSCVNSTDNDSCADGLREDKRKDKREVVGGSKNNIKTEFDIMLDFRRKVIGEYQRDADRDKLTELLTEAVSYRNLASDCFENLIEEGARANNLCGKHDDPGKHTLVDRAVILGNHTALTVLLRYGAHINVPTGFWGQTALHRAVLKGDPNIVRILLENGAHATAMDKNFKTPRDMARLDPEINGIFTRHNR